MLDIIYKDKYYLIKQACIEVRKVLGNGFLEKIYESALALELEKSGFLVETQKQLSVNYKGHVIGDYIADIVVDEKIIIELKAVNEIIDFHKAQLLNYLTITGYKLGLLINFPNNKAGFTIEYQI
ncbi:MAG: GxxExxY protein [Candidatus Cloacimonetes bacterium]|nr:GxxExxY protein [Candidatus Cloacimonadota bacterium]